MDNPKQGDWPCQVEVGAEARIPPRLEKFLYRLLRDGATSPGDVEHHAVESQVSQEDGEVLYTNPHLQAYARSLAAYLTR